MVVGSQGTDPGIDLVRVPRRAAEYVRKSTDHQRYSIASQQEANRAFAAAHNMTIVATYADAGKSGVTVAEMRAIVLGTETLSPRLPEGSGLTGDVTTHRKEGRTWRYSRTCSKAVRDRAW